MKVIKKVNAMQDYAASLKRQGLSIGFVPTMGYLHEGHISLMRQAKSDNDICLISIFVNPLQFSPQEDFKSYPRDFRRDLRLARNAGVDIVFFPDAREMYAEDFSSEVYVRNFSKILCGLSRPEHFKGVTIVVSKLFNIVLPDIAYFGQKDFQQARIIVKMAEDLNFPIKIRVMPIIREPDGLAMSSRNVNLSSRQRSQALILNRALNEGARLIRDGARSSGRIVSTIKNLISTVKSAKIDYVEIVDADTLKHKKLLGGKIAILLAVKFGKVRLIDNKIIRV
jgi:pantoate--beta-alanine ligase